MILMNDRSYSTEGLCVSKLARFDLAQKLHEQLRTLRTARLHSIVTELSEDELESLVIRLTDSPRSLP